MLRLVTRKKEPILKIFIKVPYHNWIKCLLPNTIKPIWVQIREENNWIGTDIYTYDQENNNVNKSVNTCGANGLEQNP